MTSSINLTIKTNRTCLALSAVAALLALDSIAEGAFSGIGNPAGGQILRNQIGASRARKRNGDIIASGRPSGGSPRWAHNLIRQRKTGNGGRLSMVLDLPREKSVTPPESIIPSSGGAPPPLPSADDPQLMRDTRPEEETDKIILDGLNNIILTGDLPLPLSTKSKAPTTPRKESTPSPAVLDGDGSETQEDDDASSEALVEAPGVRKIIKFAIPAIGVWLCGPLLSLIDTAAVGLLAGTSHQAALSPAVAVTDYSCLLLACLYAATTNLVAASTIKKTSVNNTKINDGEEMDGEAGVPARLSPQATLLSSLQLSLLVGTGLGTVMYCMSKVFVRALVGSEMVDPAVFLPAVQYVKIRSLGMPAAAVLGSAQAACLGLKDIKSPLLVLLSAAVINLVGDALFVGSKHALFHGAAGAAWATVFSQYAAVVFFLHWLKTREGSARSMLGWGNSTKGWRERLLSRIPGMGRKRRAAGADVAGAQKIVPVDSTPPGSERRGPLGSVLGRGLSLTKSLNMTSRPAVSVATRMTSTNEEEFKRPKKVTTKYPTRGYLSHTSFRKRDIVALPSKTVAKEFLPYVVPVTTTSVGRVSLFLTMAHVVSSCMGQVGMAAQQIVLALFEALAPIADSLSLTAQSFIPALHERAREEGDSREVAKATRQFFQAGGVFGAVMIAMVACIPLISRMFTTDPLVVVQVNSMAKYLAGVCAVQGVVIASEGVLLGRRDLKYMGRIYGIYFALVPAIMLRLKKGFQVAGTPVRLQSLWTIFLAYNLSRMALWMGRGLWLARSDNRHVERPISTSTAVQEKEGEDVPAVADVASDIQEDINRNILTPAEELMLFQPLLAEVGENLQDGAFVDVNETN